MKKHELANKVRWDAYRGLHPKEKQKYTAHLSNCIKVAGQARGLGLRILWYIPCQYCKIVFTRTLPIITQIPLPCYCSSSCNNAAKGNKQSRAVKGRAVNCTICRTLFINKTPVLGKTCSSSCAYKLRGRNYNTHFSAEVRGRLSKSAKDRGLGGYVQGYVKGHKGWYAGMYCDSSWELAVILYCSLHGYGIKRCTEERQYTYENKVHRYYPDFVIDGVIVEVKGYLSDSCQAKHNANPDIVLLPRREILGIIKEVKLYYGVQFRSLLQSKL